MPRISINIDALLSRHNIVGGIDNVNLNTEEAVDLVNRINFNQKKKAKQIKHNERQKPRGNIFCPDCHYLSKKLKLDINYAHYPAQCPRSKAAVHLLHAEESILSESEDDDEAITGKIVNNENS